MRWKIFAIIVAAMIIGGFIVLILGIAVGGDQSKTPFHVALGLGLSLIVLGIIVMLIGLIVFCCQEIDCFGPSSYSYEGRGGRVMRWPSRHDDTAPSAEQLPFINLSRYLREECEAQNETDVTLVCDKLKDKWYLPHQAYNMFDVALLSRTLHKRERYESVSKAAREMFNVVADEWRWLNISPDFRSDLMKIRSNQEPADYSVLANVYVLLKSKSNNANHTDYSPKSNIRQWDIPTETGYPAAPNTAMFQTENRGVRPSAPSEAQPEAPPPSYEEVVKS